jgi:dienelactone hydrolase
VLKFVSAYLALSYLALATCTVIGVLQILAAWSGLHGLALLDYRKSRAARALGPAVIALGYAWFFGTRREIITPGPAGTELVVLFGGGVLLALAFCTLGAVILRPYRLRTAPTQLAGMVTRAVTLETGVPATLYYVERPGAAPAVCLLPDPATPVAALTHLIGRLVGADMAVLVPGWPGRCQQCPDALAIAPAALNYLSSLPFVTADRLAVGGVNLGGDLALRAAVGDAKVQAVFALAPELAAFNLQPNLGWLREMTLADSLRWGLRGRRQRLTRELDVLSALTFLGPRPCLVLYGDDEPLVDVPAMQARLEQAAPAVSLRSMPGAGHLTLATGPQAAETVATWLAHALERTQA